MKLALIIHQGTKNEKYLVSSLEEIKNIIESEYNWNHIYGVHNHYASLHTINEDNDITDTDAVARLNLPTHDSYSSEDMIDEDDGDITNLYSRLARKEFTEDYDGSINEFTQKIN